MQTYNLDLSQIKTRAFPAQADLFVYESGKNGEDGETRIIVKPDSGGEIVLRPGQRFRLPPGEKAQQWLVRPFDGVAPIAGAVIIGSGDFDDANTLNKVQLDATFANVVKVTNTTAERVPVALDPNQLIQSTAPVMAYTNAKNKLEVPVSSIVTLIPASENLNGVIVESWFVSGTGSVFAPEIWISAAAPVGLNPPVAPDGVFLGYWPGKDGLPVPDRTRIKIPAGKGVHAVNASASNAGRYNILYTVL